MPKTTSSKKRKRKLTCKQREKRYKFIIYILLSIIFMLLISQIYILKKVDLKGNARLIKKEYVQMKKDINNEKNKITGKNENDKDYINNKKNINIKNNKNNIEKSQNLSVKTEENETKKNSNNSNVNINNQYDENESINLNKNIKIEKELNYLTKSSLNYVKQEIESKIITEFGSKNKKYIVLILDDAGYKDNIKLLSDLHFKINISIIPDLPYTRKNYNDIIKSSNLFPMIHIPMEPKNKKVFKIDSDFITLNDNEDTIFAKLLKFKTQIPTNYANNHMGSLISENYEKSFEILKILKRLSINFIDSKTSSKSKFKLQANKLNLKIFSNSIFLDNNNEEKFIIINFYRGLSFLNKEDFVIMIGHITKDKTILFLRWMDKIKIYNYFKFITVKELFEMF